jgi:hypothetical protein
MRETNEGGRGTFKGAGFGAIPTATSSAASGVTLAGAGGGFFDFLLRRIHAIAPITATAPAAMTRMSHQGRPDAVKKKRDREKNYESRKNNWNWRCQNVKKEGIRREDIVKRNKR